MKEELKALGAFVLMVIFLAIVFAYQGEKTRQKQIEQRALRLDKKECYDWQDIEMIIFGEIQE